MPQENPQQGVEKPIWRGEAKSNGTANGEAGDLSEVNGHGSDGEEREPVFMTPMYDRLETNIPRSLMRFSDHPFDDRLQLFPKHDDVLDYLESYARDVKHLISFHTQVVDVRPAQEHPTSPANGADGAEHAPWTVRTLSLRTNETTTQNYDAVALASGHFNIPYIPRIPGIRAWAAAYPGAIAHSKHYRHPARFRGKKVVVVGNSASGLDISAQLAPLCQPPLLLSQKSASYLSADAPARGRADVPPIAEFVVAGRAVRFADGRVETGVDAVLFCTGYLYAFPFLAALAPPPVADGASVHNTYRHLFYAPRPTLAFLALAQKIIPFPHAEAQAAVLGRMWSGRLGLPDHEVMRRWEEGVVRERGAGGEFHTLHFPKDGEYINEMWDWAAEADGETGGGDGQGEARKGKMPKRWGQWEFWTRERFPAIRGAFVGRGEGRKDVTRLEELGFDFEAWREERRKEGKGLL